MESTVKLELAKLGLSKLMKGLLTWEDRTEGEDIFYDIVCIKTGDVFCFSTSVHCDEKEFFAANENSLNAFKSDLKIEIE